MLFGLKRLKYNLFLEVFSQVNNKYIFMVYIMYLYIVNIIYIVYFPQPLCFHINKLKNIMTTFIKDVNKRKYF